METSTIAGIEVSRLGLGTSRMASLGSGRSRRDAARLLDTAADLGITFVDTADTYGSTATERWLGEVMQGRQDRFAVATKCGLARADLPGPLRPLNQPAKKILQRAGQQHHLEAGHVRHSKVAQTAVNPLTTDALRSFLKSADETGTVELIGNRVFIGAVVLSKAAPKGSSPAIADLQRRLDSLSAERGLSKAHLLLRHAAAVPHVRVVLTGTGNPVHLIHNAAALAIPPKPEDLLT